LETHRKSKQKRDGTGEGIALRSSVEIKN